MSSICKGITGKEKEKRIKEATRVEVVALESLSFISRYFTHNAKQYSIKKIDKEKNEEEERKEQCSDEN